MESRWKTEWASPPKSRPLPPTRFDLVEEKTFKPPMSGVNLDLVRRLGP